MNEEELRRIGKSMGQAFYIDVVRLEDEVSRLRTALQTISDHTARCEHDGGFDREIGPIGCLLGDKCVCIGIHPIARDALSHISQAPSPNTPTPERETR